MCTSNSHSIQCSCHGQRMLRHMGVRGSVPFGAWSISVNSLSTQWTCSQSQSKDCPRVSLFTGSTFLWYLAVTINLIGVHDTQYALDKKVLMCVTLPHLNDMRLFLVIDEAGWHLQWVSGQSACWYNYQVIRIPETSDETFSSLLEYGAAVGKTTVNCKVCRPCTFMNFNSFQKYILSLRGFQNWWSD